MPEPQVEVDFVHFVINSIIDNQECYDIERTVDEKGVLLTVKIDKSYAGRIIGKGGATAQSIRTLLRALGARNNAAFGLKIEERD